ncbi:thiamine diphosphate-binding protein [Suillus placidus]|uniref:Thiamine diphosphate-binding protein n=1 Tax=Suillus placidus TaxID=48579 RepID=A0A9P7D6Q0_9AGAM|nr:thiamine diphosphate-binding protein [Suillus placidus]
MPTPSRVKRYQAHDLNLEELACRAQHDLDQRPFDWQLEVAAAVMEGYDVVLDVGTGCGKTLCFSLPKDFDLPVHDYGVSRLRMRLQYPIDRAKYCRLWNWPHVAAMGHTTIAEIQFTDYIFPVFDQLVNEAAKFRYRSGGHFSIEPRMVLHGCIWSQGRNPPLPNSCKGLLLSAIRDPDPVIFMEPKVLYRSAVEQVPINDFVLALSCAEILIPGSDLTLLTWGTPVYHCATTLRLLNSPPPSLIPLIPPSLRSAKVELIDVETHLSLGS